MRKQTGIVLIFILFACASIFGYKLLKPKISSILTERRQRNTSDAQQLSERIRIAGDNYVGYSFIRVPEMIKQAEEAGIAIDFTDDGGAYADRLQKFAEKQYDCIVLPINSYLEHGKPHNYPGVIVASISESKGADGIVGFSNKLPTGKVNDLNDSSLTFVFTGASPSEFLLQLTITDFGLDQLEGTSHWAIKVNSSREVYNHAKNNNGDIFVLWEPDISRALALPGMKYVWGSDKFGGYIIDVFVFHRDFMQKKRETVLAFFRAYFRVMKAYSNNRKKMVADIARVSSLKKDDVPAVLEKIDWYNLEENCSLQFGIRKNPEDTVITGVLDSIIACTEVMIRTNTVAKDPLKGNPRLIIDSSILTELLQTTPVITITQSAADSPSFQNIDWSHVREVGRLRVEPIPFQIGQNRLDKAGKQVVDQIVQLLVKNYPTYGIIIRGHTAPGANEDENVKLSERRADTVLQYIKAVHSNNIDVNRLKAEGVGARFPPKQNPKESPRAYRYRLSRVEFVLVETNPL